jgi:GxxExxY protein
MDNIDVDIDSLSEQVIGCAIEVHRVVGPGLSEAIYRECLIFELIDRQIVFQSPVPISVTYKQRRLQKHYELDLLVGGRLIVELKSVDTLHPVHSAQVITYLRLTGHPAGLLINFNAVTLLAGLKRFDHPDRYARKAGPIGRRREVSTGG